MSTIFYSWQTDRPSTVCRNFIEKALQSAIDRLRADIDIESSNREDLELDKDTRNVPGAPAIFDTILKKIGTASVFVPDLTFVGQRPDGRLVSNPNVLIEYGYSLNVPGAGRIIAVMNDVYGRPTAQSMPFNLAHRRFPITYSLEEGAKEEERKAARKSLTDQLEMALRAIVDSEGYKSEQAKNQPPTGHDIAASLQNKREYEQAVSAFRYGDGPTMARNNAAQLFAAIKEQCDELAGKFDLGIESGWDLTPRGNFESCVMRAHTLAVVVTWEQPRIGSLEGARLLVREYRGRLYLPGEFRGGHIIPPKTLGEKVYEATLGRDLKPAWKSSPDIKKDTAILSNRDLTSECVTKFMTLISREP
jgi:hypothetical protein